MQPTALTPPASIDAPVRPANRPLPRLSLLAVSVMVAVCLRDTSRTIGVEQQGRLDVLTVPLGGRVYTLRGRVETTTRLPLAGATLEAILVVDGKSYPVAR